MRFAYVLAALAVVSGGQPGPATGVVHVAVTLLDAAQTPMPVPRHALLISDNPATAAPRRVLTGADGTVSVTLPRGSYIVESDRPVTVLGQTYQWTVVVTVTAGSTTALQLTADNAERVAVPAPDSEVTTAPPADDPSALLARWHTGVVGIWSPTARASAFVIDGRGLLATSSRAVGTASSIDVQFSDTVKVPARVLVSSATTGAAIVWVDSALLEGRTPLPLQCPPPPASAPDDGDELTAMAAPLRRSVDLSPGEVTALSPRAIETDLRLDFGGAGGPVFDAAGVIVGLTSLAAADGRGARGDVTVVRAGFVCEATAAARVKMTGAAPPDATRLPVDPARPFPPDGLGTEGTVPSVPSSIPTITAADFDVALLTPPMVARAAARADRTGGTSARTPEVEARLGRLTQFGAWSEYFADLPPVLIIRVTPKLVEGFWKRLAREAARTQGAALPAFKDFKSEFVRMRASCGGSDVTPIHPFVLEHPDVRRPDDVVREGLYVFAPDAIGPHCGAVTLTLYAEKAPADGETIAVAPAVVEQLWQDFAAYRAAGGAGQR